MQWLLPFRRQSPVKLLQLGGAGHFRFVWATWKPTFLPYLPASQVQRQSVPRQNYSLLLHTIARFPKSVMHWELAAAQHVACGGANLGVARPWDCLRRHMSPQLGGRMAMGGGPRDHSLLGHGAYTFGHCGSVFFLP